VRADEKTGELIINPDSMLWEELEGNALLLVDLSAGPEDTGRESERTATFEAVCGSSADHGGR
jgi:hypothetical protein